MLGLFSTLGLKHCRLSGDTELFINESYSSTAGLHFIILLGGSKGLGTECFLDYIEIISSEGNIFSIPEENFNE